MSTRTQTRPAPSRTGNAAARRAARARLDPGSIPALPRPDRGRPRPTAADRDRPRPTAADGARIATRWWPDRDPMGPDRAPIADQEQSERCSTGRSGQVRHSNRYTPPASPSISPAGSRTAFADASPKSLPSALGRGLVLDRYPAAPHPVVLPAGDRQQVLHGAAAGGAAGPLRAPGPARVTAQLGTGAGVRSGLVVPPRLVPQLPEALPEGVPQLLGKIGAGVLRHPLRMQHARQRQVLRDRVGRRRRAGPDLADRFRRARIGDGAYATAALVTTCGGRSWPTPGSCPCRRCRGTSPCSAAPACSPRGGTAVTSATPSTSPRWPRWVPTWWRPCCADAEGPVQGGCPPWTGPGARAVSRCRCGRRPPR
jgi:hypothetical protein